MYFKIFEDWNYVFTSDIELTVELSNRKWPPESDLQAYWDDNYESMISYIEQVHTLGIKGWAFIFILS